MSFGKYTQKKYVKTLLEASRDQKVFGAVKDKFKGHLGGLVI